MLRRPRRSRSIRSRRPRRYATGVRPGVCAYNDEVALAVLAGVRLLGLHAPADLAVIGVDDIPSARLAAPALTTVTTDQAAMATHLAASVVSAMGGRPGPAVRTADLVRVVSRDSA